MIEMGEEACTQGNATVTELASGKIRTRLLDLKVNSDYFLHSSRFSINSLIEKSKSELIKKKRVPHTVTHILALSFSLYIYIIQSLNIYCIFKINSIPTWTCSPFCTHHPRCLVSRDRSPIFIPLLHCHSGPLCIHLWLLSPFLYSLFHSWYVCIIQAFISCLTFALLASKSLPHTTA